MTTPTIDRATFETLQQTAGVEFVGEEHAHLGGRVLVPRRQFADRHPDLVEHLDDVRLGANGDGSISCCALQTAAKGDLPCIHRDGACNGRRCVERDVVRNSWRCVLLLRRVAQFLNFFGAVAQAAE